MRSERIGILMIAASLIAAAVIVSVAFERQTAARHAQIREQGVSLVRLLSRLPYEQLVPAGGNTGLLQAVLQSGRATELGYGAIVDLRGTSLAEITSAGTIVPPAPRAGEAAAQIGVRALTSPGDARTITEFYGPLLNGGDVVGQVRVGFLDAPPGCRLCGSALTRPCTSRPTCCRTPLAQCRLTRPPLACLARVASARTAGYRGD